MREVTGHIIPPPHSSVCLSSLLPVYLSLCLPAVCPSVHTSFIHPRLPKAILTRAVFIITQQSFHMTSCTLWYCESLSWVSHSGDIMENIWSQHGTGALTWQTLHQCLLTQCCSSEHSLFLWTHLTARRLLPAGSYNIKNHNSSLTSSINFSKYTL